MVIKTTFSFVNRFEHPHFSQGSFGDIFLPLKKKVSLSDGVAAAASFTFSEHQWVLIVLRLIKRYSPGLLKKSAGRKTRMFKENPVSAAFYGVKE